MLYYGTVLSSNAANPKALGDLAAQVCALAGSSDLDQTLVFRGYGRDRSLPFVTLCTAARRHGMSLQTIPFPPVTAGDRTERTPLSQCFVWGCRRVGSTILKLRASAALRPPSTAGSAAGVSSP
jgi:hypothetical protein